MADRRARRTGWCWSESDFQRIYRSVNMYYFASWARTPASVRTAAADVLVADPVYLRRRIDPLAPTVSALLGGPTELAGAGGQHRGLPAPARRKGAGQQLSARRLGARCKVRLNDKAAEGRARRSATGWRPSCSSPCRTRRPRRSARSSWSAPNGRAAVRSASDAGRSPTRRRAGRRSAPAASTSSTPKHRLVRAVRRRRQVGRHPVPGRSAQPTGGARHRGGLARRATAAGGGHGRRPVLYVSLDRDGATLGDARAAQQVRPGPRHG